MNHAGDTCDSCDSLILDPHTGRPAEYGETGHYVCSSCGDYLCINCRHTDDIGEDYCLDCHEELSWLRRRSLYVQACSSTFDRPNT